MTMRLTIRNEDEQRVATVTVEDYKIGNPSPESVSTEDIGPGATREVWIHASRRVVVTENANATVPKR